mmetsp:Transcript_113629/g.355344  ORF Transcript_113629/g.355344 Transcript_113629/m.355344 type:complete len:85 (+) Transcript_113629:234-488(+)
MQSQASGRGPLDGNGDQTPSMPRSCCICSQLCIGTLRANSASEIARHELSWTADGGGQRSSPHCAKCEQHLQTAEGRGPSLHHA